MTIVDCPNCHGEGYDGSDEFRCPFCKGTGEICSSDDSFDEEQIRENDSE